ncbi:uncharacterized protein TRUGW13939_01908 [Talaromyces rugulosus]|uniref:EKC/KEOPS complex subunit BUD32 n=1 Tax=Talaromyces rugulosus TaxID=121627 RepID=A0A7H8QLK3_TALRU|nr:uncharacterized protein TRUGW13939_01908 [Talaromyces rugulosus]QKX54819.1 hypothetical protein TRUGW13939_01908 [Talaromyces rugulosus]
MNGYPLMLRPDGGSRMIAFGTTGIVCQNSCHTEQVIKAPLKYKLDGCSADVIERTLDGEEFARPCFEREKIIYKTLPKDPNILNCIEVTDDCIHLPFLRLGNLRDYLENHDRQVQAQTREQWIPMAVDAIALIYRFGVIHADISTRNFLVADDLSIKLCDFSGSAIGAESALVLEEDRYQIAPDSPRSIATDIFALGCLIFEISTGLRPYHEICDDDYQEIERRYSIGHFPSVDGLPYRKIIHKCWTGQYTDVSQLKDDLQKRDRSTRLFLPAFFSGSGAGVTMAWVLSLTTSTLAAGFLFWWSSRRGYWRSTDG